MQLHPSYRDISGQRFGRWVAQSPVGKTIHGSVIWQCQCDCGVIKQVDGQSLRRGLSQSCGCWQKELTQALGLANLRHGGAANGRETPEFKAWAAMKARCNNPNFRNYKNWGGRGIKVCDRWVESFENFVMDMGPRPSSKHSIDRIDNDGHYEPGNCRWATAKEQAQNRRLRMKP